VDRLGLWVGWLFELLLGVTTAEIIDICGNRWFEFLVISSLKTIASLLPPPPDREYCEDATVTGVHIEAWSIIHYVNLSAYLEQSIHGRANKLPNRRPPKPRVQCNVFHMARLGLLYI